MNHAHLTLTLEHPHVRTMHRDGGFYAWPVDQHTAILTAWQAGQAFYHGVDSWGDPLCIKLADVIGVTYRTAESIALVADEDAERKRREMLDGSA